jgi:hypothetical protein
MKIYQRDSKEISEDQKGGWFPEDALDSRFLHHTDVSFFSFTARQQRDGEETYLPALNGLQDTIGPNRLDSGLGLDVHALSRSILDSDVKVLGDV